MQETTAWTRCVAWSRLAARGAHSLNSGARISLPGRLHTLRWQDVATGERHARVEIVLDDLILLDRRRGASVAATDDANGLPFSGLPGTGRQGRPAGNRACMPRLLRL
jgi:single-stranded DNA-binding protein